METLEEIEVEGLHSDDAGQSNGWKLTEKPHPRGYRPDLPLRGNPTVITTAERKSLVSRPIVIRLRGKELSAQVERAMLALQRNESNCKSTLRNAHALVKRFKGVQEKGAVMNFTTSSI